MRIRITIELEVDDDIKARDVQAAAHDAAYDAADTIEGLAKEPARVMSSRVSFSSTRRGPS
jgi:hypothetical protein